MFENKEKHGTLKQRNIKAIASDTEEDGHGTGREKNRE